MSASHHVEIEAPREMRIDSGVFSATSNGRTIAHRSRRTTETLHLALQGIDRGSDAEVEITISARPEVLAGTTLFSALIALTLLFVRLRLKHFHLDQSFDAIVGVVLALPGIALAYISRPAEHPIASTFLFFLRGIALAPVVASFIAAIVLFAGYSLGVLDWVYTVLTVGASLAVVVLLAALVGPWLRRWPAGVTNER